MSARQATTVLVVAIVVAASAAAGEPSARQIVDALHERFIDVMKKGDSLDFQARVELLAPAVAGAFDLEFMALKSLGLGARDLNDDERQRWIAAFSAFLSSNYARRFIRYSDQGFEFVEEVPAPREQVVIRTRLTRSDKEDVQLDYRLRKTSEGWRVIDIYANGTISELALRRSEYTGVLKQDGFEALVGLVNGKIDDLAAGKQAD